MCPWFASSIAGRHDLMVQKCAMLFTLNVSSTSSSGDSRSFLPVTMPALLIRMVQGPAAAAACRITA